MGASEQYSVHEVEWTHEKIGRFWNQYSETATERYFGEMVGRSLLALVDRVVGRLAEPILDFGCGSGHLLGMLMRRGQRCAGVDFSDDSVAVVRDKYAGNPLLLTADAINGCPTQLEPDSFGTVFCVETIEHLLPDDLSSTLRELYRLTATGGCVVVTTPNTEDLDRAKVTCPDCGCRFHRVQHVSCWTDASLSATMSDAGFQKLHCQATLLAKRGLRGKIAKLARLYLLRQKCPHLVYIGRKN